MTIIIKDIALDKALDRKEMAAVRGGLANQANGTNQGNTLAMLAPVSAANGSLFGATTNIQVESNPYQSASNYSDSYNAQGAEYYWEKSGNKYY